MYSCGIGRAATIKGPSTASTTQAKPQPYHNRTTTDTTDIPHAQSSIQMLVSSQTPTEERPSRRTHKSIEVVGSHRTAPLAWMWRHQRHCLRLYPIRLLSPNAVSPS